MTVGPDAVIGAFPWNAWQVRGTTVDLTRAARDADTVIVAAEPQSVGLDLARTAVIVIDMQNEFLADGGWVACSGADLSTVRAPVAPLRALLPALRARGVPVVWVNWGNRPDRANLPPGVLHVVNPDGQGVGIGDPLPGTGSRVLQRDGWSTAIYSELSVAAEDLHVTKYRISGFFDTELDSLLRNLDVKSLLFAGVNTDQCVLSTLTDAACIGYDALLLRDCAGTTSPEYCTEATLYNVRLSIGFVIDSTAVLDALGGSPEI